MTAKGMIVVSGAPATGKSTVAAAVADGLGFPLLSLDMVKGTLADVLGIKEEHEGWSYTLGDAAAEVVFRLGDMFTCAVVEGWWRGHRRARAQERIPAQGSPGIGCSAPFATRSHRRRRRPHTCLSVIAPLRPPRQPPHQVAPRRWHGFFS
jgi:hypothetical protein